MGNSICSFALRTSRWSASLGAALLLYAASGVRAQNAFPAGPGSRVLVDAHNCYPYNGKWADRIERAIGTGTPVAIEQDLFWYTDSKTGRSWSVVAHGKPVRGEEPTLRSYFLERIRPIMEAALAKGNRGDWPVITLNLDFKTNEPQHLAAIWNLLGEYEPWLTTAGKTSDSRTVSPLRVGPLLVLTGDPDAQEKVFYDAVPVGGRLRLFGAVRVHGEMPDIAPEVLVPQGATDYRRWWNNPWRLVEKGGPLKAKDWTEADRLRLKSLVDYAHAKGLWIRFYTLDGLPRAHEGPNGWDHGYNFGSLERVKVRWKAAIEAGVDFVAADQYEELASVVRQERERAAADKAAR